MGAVDIDSFADILQDYYSKETVKDLSYEENVMYALLPKKTDCSGFQYVQPVQYGVPNGRSRQFSTAQANKSGAKYTKFNVDWADDFGVTSVNRKIMKQSDGTASFFEAFTRESDAMLKQLMRNLAISCYRGSGGARGQINSSYSSGTSITLANLEEITNFEVGDVLQFSANDGDTSTDTLIDSGGTAVISNINEDSATITLDGVTNVPSLAASYYIFIEDDFQNSVNGFLDWIPVSAPSGAFLGSVDRSTQPTRLGGHRVSIQNMPIHEAVKKMINRVRRSGGKLTHIFMDVARYETLEFELGDRVHYEVESPQDATIGFQGIKFVGNGTTKPVMVYGDINCPQDIIAGMNMDYWKQVSLGETPDVVDEDGVTMLREATASGFEFRGEYYANMVTECPRDNVVGDFTS